MSTLIDMIDMRFGRWTVVAQAPSKHGQAMWTCRCDCGSVKSVSGQHLRRGNSTGCRSCIKWGPRDGIPIPSRQWSHIKASATKRRIDFKVTRELVYDVFERQGARCALTGLPLCFDSPQKRSDGTASLDRIDSSKGYIPGNIQWVHKDINLMKGSLSQDQLLRYCSLILSHQGDEIVKQEVEGNPNGGYST